VHHKRCGGWGETTQGFVEMVGAGRDNCPKGQAKAGRNTAKRREKK